MKTWKHCIFFFAFVLVLTACDDKREDDRYFIHCADGTKIPIYHTAEVTNEQTNKAVGNIQSGYYGWQAELSGKIKEIWIIKKTETEDRYFDYDETDDNRVIIKFQYDSPRTYVANTFGWMAEGTINSDDIDPQLKIVEGFTFDNYPKADGSTSAKPLNVLIACKLLGIGHQWVDYPLDDGSPVEWTIEPVLRSKRNSEKFEEFVKTSQTHQSIVNLIDKKTDIIISARKMSPDEKTYADAAGVTLIETPVALDAFIFIVNLDNPITTLTVKQIQDIYTGKITNWNEVG
jgi:hypothetical protein